MSEMLILAVGILFGCLILYEGCKEIKKGLIILGNDIKEGLLESNNRKSNDREFK